MKYRQRIYYSASQRALIWDRWQRGETLHQIAGLFDRYHSSIQRILAETGGIRPAERRRSRLALTLPEREEISRALVAGRSIRSIAASLRRAASTVSRAALAHVAWLHGLARQSARRVPRRLADFETRYGGTVGTITVLVGIAIALFLVAIAAFILATVEWLAMCETLGATPSNKLELHLRKAFHVFKRPQM